MIALIDYGAGNTASVANALDELGVDYLMTKNTENIYACEKIILPGVGEASFAVTKLRSLGLFDILKSTNKPLLGICLGMQLLCERSMEGNTQCLGVFPVICEKFDSSKMKVPHMGWNNVYETNRSVLFDGIKKGEFFYFANSFFVPMNEFTTASCNNGIDFSAVIEKENYHGVQFHPEKSGKAGMILLKNFVEKC